MKIRQLFDQETWTYTYILYDEESKQAAIIDSVKEQHERDKTFIKNLGLTLKYAFETHVHADHITGAGLLRNEFACQVGVHKNGKVNCADLNLADGDVFKLGNQEIQVIHTPGHTSGDVCYRIMGAVFTGDTLLIHGCGRTDFQEGNSATLYESITNKLFTLPAQTVVYPGHDYSGFTSSTVEEEKIGNPRLADNKSKEEFIKIMDGLNLAKPKKIDVAVPGNLVCGLLTDN